MSGEVFVSVACGKHHSLALTCTSPILQIYISLQNLSQGYPLLASGKIYSWGSNSCGQLGLGDTVDRSEAQLVAANSNVVFIAVAAGYYHSLALTGTFASHPLECHDGNDDLLDFIKIVAKFMHGETTWKDSLA